VFQAVDQQDRVHRIRRESDGGAATGRGAADDRMSTRNSRSEDMDARGIKRERDHLEHGAAGTSGPTRRPTWNCMRCKIAPPNGRRNIRTACRSCVLPLQE